MEGAPQKDTEASQWETTNLVEAALIGEPRDSIGKLLKVVAELCDSCGCVLWRASSHAKPNARPPQGHLSMLAGWFNTKRSQQFVAIHHLLFEKTIAGRAVCNRTTAFSNDMAGENITHSGHPFFKELGINKTLAVPIRYPDGRLGAISLYRRAHLPIYQKRHGEPLKKAARLVPILYKAVRERAAFQLLEQTGEILRNYRPPKSGMRASVQQTRTLQDLCVAIQKMFQAMEVSIFLETEKKPGVYTCSSTTAGPHTRQVLNLAYTASFEDGFSGLALKTGKPVRIYDTQKCAAEMKELKEKYPEFERVARGRSEEVNRYFGVPEGWDPQPHSLMVVPLVSRQKTLGLLRCWIAKDGPPFFSTEDLELLQLVGEQFAHTVETWNQQRHGAVEREAWTKLGRNIGKTKKARTGNIQPGDPYARGLELVGMCINDTAVNTIRLRDAGKNDLYFHVCFYKESANLTDSHVREITKTRFSLRHETPQSLAANVIKKRKGMLIEDVTLEPLYVERFPGVKKMIITPIFDGQEAVGVLDIRSYDSEPFPTYALPLAETVGRLLGVYADHSKAQRDATKSRGDVAAAKLANSEAESKELLL